jgi:4-hydroxy-3-methylbut-2-enyl diphosphate reductase
VFIVIGGAHSNNTHELVNTCTRFCARVHHVQTADDLQVDWFADAQNVGITAGTSTPDSVINAVEQRLSQITPVPTSAKMAEELLWVRLTN